jgi:thioredoxin 1
MLDSLVITVVLVVLGMGAFYAYRAWALRHALRTVSYADTLRQHNIAYHDGTPSIVLFTADYCAPCKLQQRPVLKQLSQTLGESVQVLEIDVQAQPDLASTWGVMSLPTLFILDKQGKPTSVNQGVTPLKTLQEQLKAVS